MYESQGSPVEECVWGTATAGACGAEASDRSDIHDAMERENGDYGEVIGRAPSITYFRNHVHEVHTVSRCVGANASHQVSDWKCSEFFPDCCSCLIEYRLLLLV